MLALLWILLGCASYAQTPSPAQPAPGIFGRVLNSATHEPVHRATIKVYTSKDQWDALTDGDGRFTFPDLDPGDYGLVAHRDGYTDRAYISNAGTGPAD